MSGNEAHPKAASPLIDAGIDRLLLGAEEDDEAAVPLALDAMLAPGFTEALVPPLSPGRKLRAYFSLLAELSRFGEADFVVRLGVVAELAGAEKTHWTADELHQHFPWLAEGVRKRVLRGLRRSGWLTVAPGPLYALSDQGEHMYSLLSSLVGTSPGEGELALGVLEVEVAHHMGSDTEAPLLHLQHNLRKVIREAEEALTTHSEVKILDVRHKLDRNLAWSIRARKLLDQLELEDFASYKAAQSIGRSLSELHQWHGALQRALNDIARRSIRLDESGLSLTDITQFLMRCELPQMAEFGAHFVADPPRPRFSIVDNALSEAEYFFFLMERDLDQERRGWSVAEPLSAEQKSDDGEGFSGLARFATDMDGVMASLKRPASEPDSESAPSISLTAFVPRETWAESAYRLSLLCLMDAGPENLPNEDAGISTHLTALRKSPIALRVTGRTVKIEGEAVSEMSEGVIVRREDEADYGPPDAALEQAAAANEALALVEDSTLMEEGEAQ
jgi:hypothetical protein